MEDKGYTLEYMNFLKDNLEQVYEDSTLHAIVDGPCAFSGYVIPLGDALYTMDELQELMVHIRHHMHERDLGRLYDTWEWCSCEIQDWAEVEMDEDQLVENGMIM